MKKILTLQWIPCEERLPDNNDYIMLSFENYSLPEIGRYDITREKIFIEEIKELRIERGNS